MTDQTTATEAGRDLVMAHSDAIGYVLAIEAEARADALREAADAVQRYGNTLAYRPDDPDPDDVIAAVLAILDPQP